MRRESVFLMAIILILVASGTVFADLYNGLVADYSFSGNANDTSGYGYHGTVEGATLTIDRFGNPNSAYSFDGIDDRIVIGDVELATGNQLSIQAWFKADSELIYSRPLVSKLFGGVAYYLGGALDRYNPSGTRLQFLVNSTRDSTTLTNGAVNDGLWHHVVGVYDGTLPSDNIILYIDDILQSRTTDYNQNINDVIERLCIGGNDFGGPQRDFFEGIIDDVRIYNRALTASEVHDLNVVPLPGAALLGAIGMAFASWRLRRMKRSDKEIT